MLIEKRVLVTLFLKEEATKEMLEREVMDQLTADGGGLLRDFSLDAESINVKEVEVES